MGSGDGKGLEGVVEYSLGRLAEADQGVAQVDEAVVWIREAAVIMNQIHFGVL